VKILISANVIIEIGVCNGT